MVRASKAVNYSRESEEAHRSVSRYIQDAITETEKFVNSLPDRSQSIQSSSAYRFAYNKTRADRPNTHIDRPKQVKRVQPAAGNCLVFNSKVTSVFKSDRQCNGIKLKANLTFTKPSGEKSHVKVECDMPNYKVGRVIVNGEEFRRVR